MSRKQKEIGKIRETIRHFYWAQETGDENAFLSVWHPEAKRFGFGLNNELYVLSVEDILRDQFNEIQKAKEENPKYSVSFFIKQMKFFDVQPDNLIASVFVEWQMLVLGKCVGFHYTYYHLVKTEDQWVIVNVTDRARIPP
ncbi:MAG: nuclear transport factor 2 family protein [Promethearchaeota archaeon]